MAGSVRFVGVPRSVLNTEISEMVGWREMGNRMLEQAKAKCPVSSDDPAEGGASGPHLKDTLVARFITGPDPRIMIGSTSKGDVLGYLTNGTTDHPITPVNATVLAWTTGGTTFFSKGHMVRGIAKNPFLMDAIREVASRA